MKKIICLTFTALMFFSLSVSGYAVGKYTNIIDSVGYKDDIRLSSSDGISERYESGYTTTGLICLDGLPDGTILRTKGVNFNTEEYPSSYIYTYNADGSFCTVYSIKNSERNNVVFEVDSDGNLVLIFDMSNTTESMKYFRLVGYGKGENLIITINEEIIDTPDEPDTPVEPDIPDVPENPSTETIIVKEDRPFFTTPLNEFSVTEGLLLLIFVTIFLKNIFNQYLKGN